MEAMGSAAGKAVELLLGWDPALAEIIRLSLFVTLAALAIAGAIGIPLGALLATSRFPGRTAVMALLNALMGLPPVVVGLAIYLLLSRSGPMGGFGLLYTPAAMIIAQAVLITPIVAALSRQAIEDAREEYADQLRVFGLGPAGQAATLIYEARFSLLTALLAGFGRAVAEVGAVMIVGGNINHVTRTMTTAIALETSRGELALALALGIILIGIAMLINVLALSLRTTDRFAATA